MRGSRGARCARAARFRAADDEDDDDDDAGRGLAEMRVGVVARARRGARSARSSCARACLPAGPALRLFDEYDGDADGALSVCRVLALCVTTSSASAGASAAPEKVYVAMVRAGAGRRRWVY